jgi:4-hydroxybenzoyl-CoA reductase subunit beta
MRLPKFEWVYPSSLREAAMFLKAQGSRATVMAGGTDLVISMKQRTRLPSFLVNLKSIPGLAGIRSIAKGGGISIGPLTKLSDLVTSPEVSRIYPELSKAASVVGSYQIRNQGTLGGNLCLETKCHYVDQSASWWTPSERCRKRGGNHCYVLPSSTRGCFALLSGDTVPALIAYKAQVRITGPEAERVISLEDLYTGQGLRPFNLRPEEILSEILLPPADGTKVSFFKYGVRNTVDFALVSGAVGFKRSSREARIVVGGVASGPLRAKEAEDLLIQNPEGDVADETGRIAAAKLKMVSWIRGSVSYKREMIHLLVRDAVNRLQERITS